ncbi:MAG: serpin B [Bradymonadia bacterium]|jgi:serpin B
MLPKTLCIRPRSTAALSALLLCACQSRTDTVDEPPIPIEPTVTAESAAATDEVAAPNDGEAATDLAANSAVAEHTPPNEHDMNAIVEASTDFAADLWGEVIAEHDGNALVSPASVFLALLMTEAGAAGTTQEQMDDVLQLPRGSQHAAAGKLTALLQNDEGPTIRIANRVWVESSWLARLQPEFVSTLQSAYAAEAGVVPFMGDSEGARAQINEWVSGQTETKIPELLPQGSIDSLVRLVLTNTVYFHASWNTAFNTANTETGQFETEAGPVAVPMMNQRTSLPFVENDSWMAVEVPYAEDEWSMIAVLPKDGADVDLAAVPAAFARAQAEPIALSFPRFTYRHAFSVAEPMQRLGMTEAFDADAADFSAMAQLERDQRLYISKALHEAVVEFTETGTEAAAATAIIMTERGGVREEPEYREVSFDRPFDFVIQHRETGTILFMGHVEDPSAG